MISVVQNNDVYEVRFPYNPTLVQMVKQVPGRRWHPDNKYWSIPLTRLGFLIAQLKGTSFESQLNIVSDEDIDVNATIDEPNHIPEIDISDMNQYVQEGQHLFNHQIDMLKFAKWRLEHGLESGFVLADQMGCISGDGVVRIREDGKTWTREATLKNLYKLFKSGGSMRIRTLDNGRFAYKPVANVLYKGTKHVIQIQAGEHTLKCTPDHKILTKNGWVPASDLKVGDVLLMNGEVVEYKDHKAIFDDDIDGEGHKCPRCQSTEDIVSTETEITSIIDEGEEIDVYDVTIGDPIVHNFVCNHFVVHNCGKSLEVMNWAMYLRDRRGAKHCLIIACVNAAKYNWREDIIKHTNGTENPYILGTRLKRDGSLNLTGSSQDKLDDLTTMKMYGGKTDEDLPYFLILNIEAIRMRKGKKYPIADKLIELINDSEIALIALDEAHRGLAQSAIQGKQVLRIKKECKKKIQWIPMTGTPIVSKPTDVFLPLRLVDGHESNSYYMWCQNYCIYGGFGGHEIIGYKNVPQLKNLLQPNMLRRLKKDILDLPPKVYFTDYVDNSEYQQKLYKKILNETIAKRDETVKSLNPLASFLHLRQVNGSPELVDEKLNTDDKSYLTHNAKLTRLLELLDDILSEPSEKVVLFSNWVEPLRTIYKYVSKKYKCCCYTGTMKADVREQHKQAFINDPERRIMMGTIGALGTSHTLTVARNVIFYDSPWNPADIAQAEDRCHRPGTTDTVFVHTLITRGTVDERVHEILNKKEGTANYIVDGELDLHSHPELFDLLLRD